MQDPKYEIRISKSETNQKFKSQMFKTTTPSPQRGEGTVMTYLLLFIRRSMFIFCLLNSDSCHLSSLSVLLCALHLPLVLFQHKVQSLSNVCCLGHTGLCRQTVEPFKLFDVNINRSENFHLLPSFSTPGWTSTSVPVLLCLAGMNPYG